MSNPSTAAGREMLGDLMFREHTPVEHIVAIEQEARAALLDELEAKVARLQPIREGWTEPEMRARVDAVNRSLNAVLALLREARP